MVKISNTVIKNPSQSRVGSVALSFSLCLSTIFVATRRRARARGRERLGAEARRGVPRRRRGVVQRRYPLMFFNLRVRMDFSIFLNQIFRKIMLKYLLRNTINIENL